MPEISYQGPNRLVVRKRVVPDPDIPVWADDTDWADPSTTITAADFDTAFWGVTGHRGGGGGPLKQLKLDFVFLDEDEAEVAGVTFDYYTFDCITREEANIPRTAETGGARHIIRKTGEGSSFAVEESMIVDVNETQAMGVCMSNITGADTATHYFIIASEAEYS